jgi:uncharacterized membrane protein YeaQ/YmgE (transglycosylase-associated protein family)
MPDIQLSPAALEWVHNLLTWIGFGTLAGLTAKAIMPGRDPGGAIATLCMGIGGTIIGCSVLMYLTGGQRISPVSPTGFVVGTGGAFVILAFARLLGVRKFREVHSSVSAPHYSRRGRTERVVEERD